MAGKCYYITSERRRWQFEVDGEQYGPYSTERDAIAAATVEARQALRDGSPEAQILARSAGDGGYALTRSPWWCETICVR